MSVGGVFEFIIIVFRIDSGGLAKKKKARKGDGKACIGEEKTNVGLWLLSRLQKASGNLCFWDFAAKASIPITGTKPYIGPPNTSSKTEVTTRLLLSGKKPKSHIHLLLAELSLPIPFFPLFPLGQAAGVKKIKKPCARRPQWK